MVNICKQYKEFIIIIIIIIIKMSVSINNVSGLIFKMKDGSIPIKTSNKGVYNPNTFKKDYYANSSKSKTVENYIIKIYDVNVKQYVNYMKSLKKSKLILA